MLSPLDLQNKKVETKKRKYYDKDEMDEYLELVFDQYKELYTENQELKKNVKTLSDGVQYYRSIESTMQKALVLAEKTAKETKDAAQLKAEAIEKDANMRAEKIVTEAEQEYDKLRDKCLYLVQQFNQYKVQLKQVASAQLELVNSESFDVYSPEIEAIQMEKSKLPETVTPTKEKPKDNLEEMLEQNTEPVNDLEFLKEEDSVPTELLIDESVLKEEETESVKMSDTPKTGPADLDKTMILPDVKKMPSDKKKKKEMIDDLDILTADTIDLSSSLETIRAQANTNTQKPAEAKVKEVQDALVLEPVDAVVTEPMDLTPVDSVQGQSAVLEPEPEKKKEAPTLDSLLQSINIGKKNKKKKGQDEDPFEFLGSVDDF